MRIPLIALTAALLLPATTAQAQDANRNDRRHPRVRNEVHDVRDAQREVRRDERQRRVAVREGDQRRVRQETREIREGQRDVRQERRDVKRVVRRRAR